MIILFDALQANREYKMGIKVVSPEKITKFSSMLNVLRENRRQLDNVYDTQKNNKKYIPKYDEK